MWSAIGILSGWVGFLASRSDRSKKVQSYLLVGVAGAVIGGMTVEALGLSETVSSLDPISAFNALIVSGLFITFYIVIIIFFRKHRI